MMSEHGNIVIVDDEQDIIDLLSYELQYEGFQVRHANNSVDALALLRQQAPDLLLTDVRMPKMDGVELVQKVRGDLGLNMPIIVITGFSEYEEQLSEYEGVTVVRKPIKVVALTDLIKKVLPS